jgi:hypothetical protein
MRHLVVQVESIILFEVVMEFTFDNDFRAKIKFLHLLFHQILYNLSLNILHSDLTVSFNERIILLFIFKFDGHKLIEVILNHLFEICYILLFINSKMWVITLATAVI